VSAGYCTTPGDVLGVAVSGNYVYAASDWNGGLQVINVIDPTTPFVAGFCDTPGSAWDVAVSGSFAYVADWHCGLRVIAIGDPEMPWEAGFLDTPGNAWSVTVAGSYAFIADSSGLRMVDISIPWEPSEVGFYDSQLGIDMNVAISGNNVVVAEYRFLSVYHCSIDLSMPEKELPQPSTFGLSAFPNPFNPRTTISFSLPQAGGVKLAVYDVLGRYTSDLPLASTKIFSAGEHHVTFDGSGLASGTYFLKMETQGCTQTRRLILSK
jgi:hypothetical protein